MRLIKLFNNLIERVSVSDEGIQAQLEELGIIKLPPHVVGAGGEYGDVLEGAKPNTVVKLTDDEKEAEVARRVQKNPSPGIVKVESVYELNTADENMQAAWAIVAERLLPISEEERLYVAQSWATCPRMGWGIDDEVLAGWKQKAPQIAPIVASAKKLGFIPDIHSENVMKRKSGELVLADLGPVSLD